MVHRYGKLALYWLMGKSKGWCVIPMGHFCVYAEIFIVENTANSAGMGYYKWTLLP
jgi:hypothetical protein